MFFILGSLDDELVKTAELAVEDTFIRHFMYGTWHKLFLSELIIKRRHNMIILAGLVTRQIHPRKIYFLQGYTERLLSAFLKQPIKVEIQTVENRKDVIFKYI